MTTAAAQHRTTLRSSAGFTFVEVVLAVVMVAFVGGVILSILSNSRRATSETRTQVARQATLRGITEVIELDLERTSFSTTAPAGLIAPAINGTGATLHLIDDRVVTYYLDEHVVYRTDSLTGGERPVASEVESIEFTADPAARTITVNVAPLAPGSESGDPNAFAVDLTRLVRNP